MTWERVKLGEVLKRRPLDVNVDPNVEYQFAGVYSFGRGVFRSLRKRGSEFSYKQLTRVRAGEFMYPKLMAWEGALGVVPAECDGCVVSPEFPVFEIDGNRVIPAFLDRYFRRAAIWPSLAGGSGGTNVRRRRINPDDFLALSIELPPLTEQRRIVERIEAVAKRVEEIRCDAARVDEELSLALRASFTRIVKGAPPLRLGEIAPIVRRPVEIDETGTYHELGVRSFGRGLFEKPDLVGGSLTWQKLFRIETGDLVFSNIKGWEGAFAVAGPEHHGRVGSHRYLTCVTDSTRAIPGFLWYFLQSPDGLLQIQEASPGSADRNRTLSQTGLAKVLVPTPALESQVWFSRLLDTCNRFRARRTDQSADLDALLPAVLDRAFRGEL